MDNNHQDNGFGTSGGYTSPETPYNPDAQYGFSSPGTDGQRSGTDAGSPYGGPSSGSAFSGQQTGGYNLNGQQYNNYQTGGSGAFQNSSGQFNSYSYNNGNYSTNNNGSAPLDRKGQPMKNNFGMKLTFSIIEMVVGLLLTLAESWCFGLIPLVLAVIACVMVCMQNKHYREGNWNGFSSARKASTALLWVAFGFYMAFLVLVIVVVIMMFVAGASFLGALGSEVGLDALKDLQDKYESDYETSDDWFDEEFDDYNDNFGIDSDNSDSGTDSTYKTISGENLYIDGFNDFTLNGSRLSLPMDMEDFYQAGFQMNDEDMDALIPADGYDGYAYYDKNGNYLGTVFVYNVTDEELKVEDGIAAGITINRYDDVEMQLVNGITFDTSSDEAVAALGNPTGTSGSDGSVFLEWYMNDRYGSSLELDYWDGELSEVWIMNDLALKD